MIDSDHSSDWASSASASNGGHGTPTTDHTINVVIRYVVGSQSVSDEGKRKERGLAWAQCQLRLPRPHSAYANCPFLRERL